MVNAINAPCRINISPPHTLAGTSGTAAAHTPLSFAGFRVTPG